MKRFLRLAAGCFAALATISAASAAAPVTGRAQELRFTFGELMRETGSDYQSCFERMKAKRRIAQGTASARRRSRRRRGSSITWRVRRSARSAWRS
jgi:hypothetical protein